MSLRACANDEGSKMAYCFEESRCAYLSGDGAMAKALSNEGKEHKAMMEQLNEAASAWIFASELCFSRRRSSDGLMWLSLFFGV